MLKTVAYADIFDYPLTKDEIERWLIKGDNLEPEPGVVRLGRHYCLKGRRQVVKVRQQRLKASRLKWPLAKKAGKILGQIPWVKLVCVTGALAMDNSGANDDVDLMVITAADRLWLTRLIASILLWPYLRRGRQVNNRLCLNLWLDTTALGIPKNKQTLYTAHEVCQARPVFNRDNTYQQFIGANLWYRQYLVNWKI
jgi:hypothetical protein